FIGAKNVTALVRPIYSPYMWQCWSRDGGATWDAAVRATFPGYAQSMIRTASGKIACAHRYPQYSVNISRDGGLHWDEGTVIDYPAWAMGCIVEVEPDVLLCTYMNWDMGAPLLAQLVRMTNTGIEPIDVALKQ
ncbi:MAG: exo-alpha-sialidase, partial [Pirellulales bacterium]|nr:exo-alpha-sialidase [Pirellulales bacterium]